jgi:Protein of unknown function (DUF1517)
MEDAQRELWASVLGLSCCAAVALALVLGVVWLVRARGAPRPVAPADVPLGPTHLSVLAIALNSVFRRGLEQAAEVVPGTDPVVERLELVRRVAAVLLGAQSEWTRFGYGERDLADLDSTRERFLTAVSDFRARARSPSDGGPVVVVTLILATRAPVQGVNRLDSRDQARTALDARTRLRPDELLGAEVIFTPDHDGVSDRQVSARFPEMMPLAP